jgi:hypothetical protein
MKRKKIEIDESILKAFDEAIKNQKESCGIFGHRKRMRSETGVRRRTIYPN